MRRNTLELLVTSRRHGNEITTSWRQWLRDVIVTLRDSRWRHGDSTKSTLRSQGFDKWSHGFTVDVIRDVNAISTSLWFVGDSYYEVMGFPNEVMDFKTTLLCQCYINVTMTHRWRKFQTEWWNKTSNEIAQNVDVTSRWLDCHCCDVTGFLVTSQAWRQRHDDVTTSRQCYIADAE